VVSPTDQKLIVPPGLGVTACVAAAAAAVPDGRAAALVPAVLGAPAAALVADELLVLFVDELQPTTASPSPPTPARTPARIADLRESLLCQ